MTSRPVRIGVQVQPQHASYEKIRASVLELEQLGVDILFNWDHFFPLSGDPDGLHFEAWTELASWAELTTRVEFGTLVNCNSYRNPDLQADMARTIDHISGKGTGTGRFIFGTGSGWFERDYDEYGYEFGTAGQRLDALAEALPRIESRWQKLNPAPSRDIPILIGGAGEKKTLRIVAKHADIWHSFVSADDLPRKLDILREHGESVGRDVSEIELSNEPRRKDLRIADQLREQGVTLFTLGISGPDYDTRVVKEWLAWRDTQNA
ncbi:putative F420-dependent oxidoreductase [Microbacteriaceae bacterium SG_E_30_P1]|uniref:F420-dependent oxidoreductase n=1 Tax=Antiquaquibacter oligotrophicus TaxID=2880260 RepID=A0ABT6KN57_9MICO|nr:LLM class F420-dependent oxidoreductase [Antiquaquibacter oligotrophicus]MDH6181438.1 putative F420-dependent oxidoreductase [Antiquaquibacter oligotrophicus]UDF12871.1 LLM class F420-dependent oxidoreductase [Antiquaquibacter oligotrophicus]